MKYINYNSQNNDKLCLQANKMIDYSPKNVRNDRYYKMISRAKIMEICCKNKQIIRSINNKSRLDLEEYTDLIQGIGIMIKDYCKNIFLEKFEQVLFKYNDYDFSVDRDNLIDIALGTFNNTVKWCLKNSNNDVWILKYKYNKQGKLIACKGTKKSAEQNILVSGATVIQIGMLKMFISDTEHKVYCFSAIDEYLYVKKDRYNNYSACPRVA